MLMVPGIVAIGGSIWAFLRCRNSCSSRTSIGQKTALLGSIWSSLLCDRLLVDSCLEPCLRLNTIGEMSEDVITRFFVTLSCARVCIVAAHFSFNVIFFAWDDGVNTLPVVALLVITFFLSHAKSPALHHILGRAETLIYTLGLGAARLLFDYIGAQSLT